jgi:hypothetical protein
MTIPVRALLLGFCLQTAACLDLSPKIVVKDLDSGASDDFKASSCYRCATTVDSAGHGCAQEKATCDAIDLCAAGLACLFDTGRDCFGSSHQLGICSFACADKVGFMAANGPVVPALAYVQCITASCSAECYSASSDAGTPGSD